MENRYRILNIVASGNTQREGQGHGAELLYSKLRRFAAPDTFIGLRAWDTDPEALAKHVALFSKWAPIVNVFPYSWGAGEFTAKFSFEMAKRNMRIDNIIASDPVYRSQWFEPVPGLGHLMRGIGVARKGNITLAPTVLNVVSFVQTNNIPAGGRFVATSPHTTIAAPIDLTATGRRHNDMDEAHEWHDACIACAARYA